MVSWLMIKTLLQLFNYLTILYSGLELAVRCLMKMILKYILIITILILFQSCIDLGIHISDFPLDTPETRAADPGLTGHWKKISEKAEDTGIETLEFIQFNKNEYIVRSGEGVDNNLIRAFITRISGIQFLNFQDLSETKRQYVFCKYSISDENELILNFIADTLFKPDHPKTSKELRKFIKKNLGNPELFNKEMNISLQKVRN